MHKKKVTIQDIAEKANVSKSTVSRVLNKSKLVKEHKRLAVLAAMKQLDFQPNQMARSLAGGRSMTIGVLTQDIGSPFYDAVARGVNDGLKETQYSPIFVDGQWNAEAEGSAIDTLLDRRVDGIILIGGNISSEELSEVQKQKPLVVVARDVEGWDSNCIFIDNYAAAYDATQFLIKSGHQQIAFISGIPNQQDSQRREDGFQQALKDNNIALNEKLRVDGDFRPESGVSAVETLLQRGEKFSAIFCSNDEMAFGARLALFRNNIKVPGNVSIIGFDDQPMSEFMTPPLTTVRQPAYDMGVVAADALEKLLEGDEFVVPKLKTELIVRESVATI